MVFTFLKAQGHEVGKSLLEEDQLDTVPRLPAARPRRPASRSCCRPTSWSTPEFPSEDASRSRVVVPADARSRPTASVSTSARSRPRPSRRRSPTRARCSGTARWASSRSTPFADGTRAVAEALTEDRRPVGGRRRRLRGRGAQLGFDEDALRPHLHRRRRQPGVPRGQGTARHHGPGGLMARRPRPHPADGGQLEDEPQPPGGRGPGAEARLDPDATSGTTSRKVEVVVLPPFTDLRSVQTLVDGDRLSIRYGAQDVSTHDSGAYTGEISAAMLAKLGCSYVVVGHSRAAPVPRGDRRRRQRQGAPGAGRRDDADRVRRRGPRGPRRRASRCRTRSPRSTARWPASPPKQVAGLVVAYEPVWAIGTGEVATPDDAQEVCAAIRARIARDPRRRGRRRRTHPVRRLGEGRERRPGSWPRPTSTAAWWAARASRSTSSAGSAASTTCRCCERSSTAGSATSSFRAPLT